MMFTTVSNLTWFLVNNMQTPDGKTKIALLMFSPLSAGAGAEKFFVELAKNMADRGFDVDVVTLNQDSYKKYVRIMHAYYYLNIFKSIDFTVALRERDEDVVDKLGKARWVKASFSDLAKLLKSYHAVYVKNEILELLYLKLVGFKNQLPPIIIGVHTPIYYTMPGSFYTKLHNFVYTSFVYRSLLLQARLVHVSNKFSFDLLERECRIPCKLIYYPFGTKGTEAARQLDIAFDPKKINIAYIARICEQKGFSILVDFIKQIQETPVYQGRLVLNIFGSGDPESNAVLRGFAAKLDCVRYFGHVENIYINWVLDRTDLLFSPSRWDVSPFNVLEAQARGVPVFALDIPGAADIIENGETGVLAKDAQELFAEVRKYVDGKYNFVRVKIQENLFAKFGSEKIYLELYDMFKQVINKESGYGF